MKILKKLSLFIFLCATLVGVTGCGESDGIDVASASLEEIMTKIYSDIPEEDMPMLGNIDVLKDVPDNIEYYIGTTDVEYEEILASEPMMSSVAYSVVLVRMKEGADIESAKAKIADGVDPRKWLCVEVPKEDVIVKNKGNLIILIMVENEDTRTKILEGFNNL